VKEMPFDKSKISLISILFIVSLIIFLPIQVTRAQSSTTTVSVSPSNSTPAVGQTITVNVLISNVQSLYGIDLTLYWNTAVLQLESNQSFIGVETNSQGVLHNPTLIVQDAASQQKGEYDLVATSENPALAFNGSGTIRTLTFKAIALGQSNLAVSSTLAQYEGVDQTTDPITHNDVSSVVNVSSSSSTSSPTASSSTSSPSPSPSTPEFPTTTTLMVVVLLACVGLVIAVKKITKPRATSALNQR